MQTNTAIAATASVAPTPIKTKKKKKSKVKYYGNAENIKEFAELIAPTPNYANSCKQVYTFPKGETIPRRLGFYKQNRKDKLGFDFLNHRYFNKKHDYYITKNSFYAEKRGEEYLFCYDNIVIDVDKHEKRIAYKQLDYEINKLIYLLDNDYKDEIPAFNVVKSGRGVHLWIHFISFSAKLGFLYKSVTEELCRRITRIIVENDLQLEVDSNATNNASGFIRLPYTYNTKRKGFKATFEKRTTKKYDINELIEEYAIPIISKKKESENESKPKMVVLDSKYAVLHRKRMHFIEQLVTNYGGNCEGRRELMLFQYYNAAVHIYDRETARAMMKALNQRFTEPLSEKEFKCATRSVDIRGHYTFPNDKFLSLLNTDANERELYLNTSHREVQREQARREKQKRNDQIIELANKGYGQAQIAEITGCSTATVSRTLPDKKKARNEQIIKLREQGYSIRGIAEKVACSINTVQAVIKKNTTETKAIAADYPSDRAAD